MVLGSKESACISINLSSVVLLKKPAQVNTSDVKPLRTSAVMIELGPGTTTILIFASSARFKKYLPGSAKMGVPASEIKANVSPFWSLSIN